MVRRLGALAALLTLASAALAQPRLKVGDPAPRLDIEQWVKGEPVTEFRDGHVYVVEFWATWCPPCKKSIPHLTELQERHKDAATIIGISAKDANGESIDKVSKYVKTAGDTMAYTVAFDNGSKTNQAYMVAAAQRGIPTAFIVDQRGKIVWIGHPLMGLDEALDGVIKGDFNPEQAQKGDALAKEIRDLMRAQRRDEAVARIDELVNLDPKTYGQYTAIKFQHLLTTAQDRDGAYQYAQTVSTGVAKDNALALAGISWAILTDPEAASRKLDVALSLATRAVELTEKKNASILDTLARAQFENGDAPAAIATQKLAISVATPAEAKSMAEKLAKYEQGK